MPHVTLVVVSAGTGTKELHHSTSHSRCDLTHTASLSADPTSSEDIYPVPVGPRAVDKCSCCPIAWQLRSISACVAAS